MAKKVVRTTPAEDPEAFGQPVTMDQVFQLVSALNQREETIVAQLDSLKAAVEQLGGQVASAVTELSTLREQVRQGQIDQAGVDEIEQLVYDTSSQLGDALASGGQGNGEEDSGGQSAAQPQQAHTAAQPAAQPQRQAAQPGGQGGRRIGGT